MEKDIMMNFELKFLYISFNSIRTEWMKHDHVRKEMMAFEQFQQISGIIKIILSPKESHRIKETNCLYCWQTFED